MGFFDRIAEASFKEDASGRTVYFPHGVLGKGRLVSDPAREAALFRFHKRLHKYSIPIISLYGFLLGLGGGASLAGFIPVLVWAALLLVRHRLLIKGLPVHDERLTLGEAADAASRAFPPALSIFVILNGALLVAMALVLPVMYDFPDDALPVLVGVPLVAGALALALGLFLYRNRRSERPR